MNAKFELIRRQYIVGKIGIPDRTGIGIPDRIGILDRTGIGIPDRIGILDRARRCAYIEVDLGIGIPDRIGFLAYGK